MSEHPNYVVGLHFDPEAEQLLMVRKLRPDWQAGHFNGPGGKIEPNETAYHAMRREFMEETGLDVDDWQLAILYRLPAGNTLYVFSSFSFAGSFRQMEDEPLMIVRTDKLPPKMIDNLPWIIPFCIYARDGIALPVEITRTTAPC